MKPKKVSQQLLKRLAAYLNYLKSLPGSTVNISATAIARALELGDVQVRKDLARVSTGGKRRIGHHREQLILEIESFLNVSAITGAVIVCSGKLGDLLPDHTGFRQHGVEIYAVFTPQSASIPTGNSARRLPISQLDAFCREQDIPIGIIAVAPEEAQAVCDRLVSCGIRAIWNFSPVHLTVPEHIAILNENLTVSATALRIQLDASKQSRGEN